MQSGRSIHGSNAIFNACERGNHFFDDTMRIGRVLDLLNRSRVQEAFERVWEGLPTNERRTLAAVASIGPWGPGGTLYAKGTLSRFNLNKSTAQYSSRSLVRKGELEQGEDGLRLVDPLLDAWIASGRRPRR